MTSPPTPSESPGALSRDQISAGGPYDPAVSRVLLEQGVLAVNDMLDAKKQFEVKAIALLAVYVPATAATLGAPIAMSLDYAPLWFLSGVLFAIASLSCIRVLGREQYGSAGIDPRPWMTMHWLKVDANDPEKAARLHALLAHDVGQQFEISEKRNNRKAHYIEYAIRFSWFAAFAAALAVALDVWG
jgi:hypothetical protein